MTTNTFQIVADTIAEECGVPRDKITPDSHVIDDLNLDSIAFLDLCYALDVKLDIKLPFESWVNDINTGKVNSKDLFTLRNLVTELDKIIAQSNSRLVT